MRRTHVLKLRVVLSGACWFSEGEVAAVYTYGGDYCDSCLDLYSMRFVRRLQ